MSALETARNEGKIGTALQAAPMVYLTAEQHVAFGGEDVAGLFITSAAHLTTEPAPAGAFSLDIVPGVAVSFALADGEKCACCWNVTPEVTADQDICNRCHAVVTSAS